MSKAEELKKATLLIVNQSLRQILNIPNAGTMTDNNFTKFISEIIESYHKITVKSISDENKNLQKAFDSMYKNCLRLLKKHEPETLKNRLKEIQELLKQ